MWKKITGIALLWIILCTPCRGSVAKGILAISPDTGIHNLKEIVVLDYAVPGTSSAKKYSVGTHILRFHSRQLTPLQHASLSDYLQTQTAIHFKERGKGMQSSISLRGTAASHVVVKWNGFALNVPTMEQTDFSHLPLFFFDEVKIHTGGESVLYGSGAIGGSIELTTSPKFDDSLHADVRQTFGSYGYTFTGTVLRVSGKRWESRSSMLYTQAQNNYEFTNTTTFNHRRDTLKNAAYRNWGILQEMYYRAGRGHLLSVRLWAMNFYRQIQPPVSSNDNKMYYDDIYDRNFRALFNYSAESGKIKWTAQAGYGYDFERFHEDIIAADKLSVMAEGEYTWKKWSVKAGTQHEYIKPNVHAYAEGHNEWRNEIFVQLLWTPALRWLVSGGLRQSYVTDVKTPLTPSVGVSYTLLNHPTHELKLRGAFSRNIKIPSLNDRYWNATPVSLRPETGLGGETGLDYTFTPSRSWLKATTNLYYNRITDWIRWLPSQPVDSRLAWRPRNVGVVDSYGLEFLLQAQRQWHETVLELSTSYAYTPVIMRKGVRPGDTGVGQQAAFQPAHVANAVIKPTYKNSFLQAGLHYVGKRHGTDIFDVLHPYVLLDCSAGHTFKIKKLFISLLIQINNSLNTDYQNMKNYAMPGRNYYVTFRINF